jgi:putative toxin-antitoxin system antitoxin component (TIGR02293 family)
MPAANLFSSLPNQGEIAPSDAHGQLPLAVWVIFSRAKEVFGSEEDALRWLGTPVPALDCETPISHLAQPNGEQDILTVLGRLEHGVF